MNIIETAGIQDAGFKVWVTVSSKVSITYLAHEHLNKEMLMILNVFLLPLYHL